MSGVFIIYLLFVLFVLYELNKCIFEVEFLIVCCSDWYSCCVVIFVS